VGPARCRRVAHAPLEPRHIRQRGHKGDRRTSHWGDQGREKVATAPSRNVKGERGGWGPGECEIVAASLPRTRKGGHALIVAPLMRTRGLFSIAHWEGRARGNGSTSGAKACPPLRYALGRRETCSGRRECHSVATVSMRGETPEPHRTPASGSGSLQAAPFRRHWGHAAACLQSWSCLRAEPHWWHQPHPSRHTREGGGGFRPKAALGGRRGR